VRQFALNPIALKDSGNTSGGVAPARRGGHLDVRSAPFDPPKTAMSAVVPVIQFDRRLTRFTDKMFTSAPSANLVV
jgi:hypothetical protein